MSEWYEFECEQDANCLCPLHELERMTEIADALAAALRDLCVLDDYVELRDLPLDDDNVEAHRALAEYDAAAAARPA